MNIETLADGLCFGEGPRWRDGKLWFSDMHDHAVKTVDQKGRVDVVVDVASRPSGLGWLPTGELLIVSMTDRRLLRWTSDRLEEHANLSRLANFDLNDMVVDSQGRAYVGNFGFDLHARAKFAPAELIRVDVDGQAQIAAADLAFPNGTVITPDSSVMIVAESFGRRLTAFDIDSNGNLSGRRTFAELPDGVTPDGIALDAAAGVWVASPSSNECVRVEEGGSVSHRVALEGGAYACMLGGSNGDRLFMLVSESSDPETCRATRSARVQVVDAPYPHAGLP